jgi:hypothetical protein
MHYQIRGLLEEHAEDLITNAAYMVAREPTYWNLPSELKIQIAHDAAINHFVGFHTMWLMYNDTKGDDDYYEEITEIIEKHREKLVHSIDKYETEIKRKANDISKAPSYDIDLDR